MDRRRKARLDLQQLESKLQAELRRFAQEFKEEVERLKVRYAGSPEKLVQHVDELMSRHHHAMQHLIRATQQLAASELDKLPSVTTGHGSALDRMPRRRGWQGFKKPPRRPPLAGGVLVEPSRPKDLSGGAAAPLAFDD